MREANWDQVFIMEYTRLLRDRKRPSIWNNRLRVIGQVLFGMFYRGLLFSALPEEYAGNSYVVLLLVPLGSAFGTYMVSNVGTIRCNWKYPIAGAYIGEVLFGHHHMILYDSHPSLAVSVSMLCATFAWEFDRRPRGQNVAQAAVTGGARRKCCTRPCPGGCCRRLGLWGVVLAVFVALLFSYFYFNATVTTNDGETVKIREAVNNFLRSPYWKQLKKAFWLNLWDIWDEFRNNGWKAGTDRLRVLADFGGEERARLVLGVKSNATLSEIKANYHSLMKEWHPDKHQGDSAEVKVVVQEKVVEINEAYETLQKVYRRREARYGARGSGRRQHTR